MARVKEFDEEKALDKALELFWHKGYNGTSSQDLVNGLGISRSSMYDTFGDKRTLFLKALKHYQKQYSEAMLQIANESSESVKTIKQLFQTLLQGGLQDSLTKGCFVVNTAIELSSHDAEIKLIVAENMKIAEDAFYISIKKGQKNGEIKTDADARSLARFLFNSVTGLRVAFRSGQGKKALEDIIKTTLSVLD